MTETTSTEKSWQGRFIKAFLLIAFIVVAINLLSSSYSSYLEKHKVSADASPAPMPENIIKQPKEQPIAKLNYSNLSEAITDLKPMMKDFAELDVSNGAALLAYWSADHLTWQALAPIEKSKYKLVMKDPSAERGKQLCASGKVIEIQIDSTLPSGEKVFTGGLYDDNFNIYRFISVGSTGEIVADSHAKFCGIITGKNDYSNSQGGVAHAVHLVGMFDLLDNKN